jgi:hypothetical protein
MPRAGRRHLLVMYLYVIDRWWRAMLGIGVTLLVLAGGLYGLPRFLPQVPVSRVSQTSLWLVTGVGVFALLLAVFLITIRKFSYVQPFEGHLRLVTPFLRLKISYRRIRQTSCVAMTSLFPLDRYKGRKRNFLRPLMKYTAVVLDLNGLPLSRAALQLYLSPLFFPDKTSRLALLVPDWIKFSTDLENFRSAWLDTRNQPERDPHAVLLASLTKSKR